MACAGCQKRKEWLEKKRDAGLAAIRAAKKTMREKATILIFKK